MSGPDWVTAAMAAPDFWFFDGVRIYSPAWHRRLARKHAGKPCGCESCGVVGRERKGSPKPAPEPRAARGVRTRRAPRE